MRALLRFAVAVLGLACGGASAADADWETFRQAFVEPGGEINELERREPKR